MTSTLTLADLPESLAERWEQATPAQRAKAVALLEPERALQLARSERPWWFYGRSDQFAPPGDWRWWIINAGRGWGKTRTGAEWSKEQSRKFARCRFALVAATFGDGRDTMVEGDSGLLSILPPSMLRGGTIDTAWNRSMGELYLANGSQFKIFSSEKPRQLRGPQHHFAWGDEPSYWNDVEKGTAKDSTWSNLNFGLRLPTRAGWTDGFRNAAILTMTPRLVPLLKVADEIVALEPARAGLLQRDPSEVVITTGATMANLRNLDETYFKAVIAPLIGTTLGIQELGGIMLEEVEGALWTMALITRDRADCPPVGDLAKTCVALDPSGGGGAGHDEHGVIVASSAGTVDKLEMYVRADYSVNGTPTQAARRAILAAWEFKADAIVYEKNQGQKWIPATIKAVYDDLLRGLGEDGEEFECPFDASWRLPTLEPVDALTSKAQRALPVKGHYERHHVHHVGTFPTLEGQMTSWVPGDSDSPDRLDALVWAIHWLFGTGPMRANVASAARRERSGRRPNQPSSRLPSVYGYRTSR